MVNTQLLDKKIDESGLKINYICEKIGITRQALDLKKKNKRPFRISEIYVVADLLNIDEKEKENIFFAN